MRLAAIALMLALAFAGCTGDDEKPEECVENCDVTETPATPAGNETAPDNNETAPENNETANMPPEATMTADKLNGTAPLSVNVTIDAFDADGDNLTWALVPFINDAPLVDSYNGTHADLPMTIEVTFGHAGNGTLIFAVDDGTDAVGTMVNITIHEAVVGPEGPCGGEPEPCMVSEDLWAEFWSDGTCHAKGAEGSESLGYVHDRPGPGDDPVVHYVLGIFGMNSGEAGGVWIYQGGNGMDGLQLGSANAADGETTETAAYHDCANPDILVF